MKRILVALDASQRAPGVLAAASRLGELTGSRLVLFRAIGIVPDMPQEMLSVPDLRVEDVLLARAHGDLEKLASAIPTERVESIVTKFSTPWDGICRAAREQDVDLIAIGSHGFGGLDHLLGTTAAKVVNHADRNVLVVRTIL